MRNRRLWKTPIPAALSLAAMGRLPTSVPAEPIVPLQALLAAALVTLAWDVRTELKTGR